MTQQEAEVILKVNDKQSREKLEGLEAKALKLRTAFAEAFKKCDTQGIIKINRELQKTNKEINNMRINAANIRAAMVRLNEATPRELQRTISLINSELNSGRVKRGTKEWGEYVENLKQVQAELRRVRGEMELDDSSFFDTIKDRINDWGATAAAAMGAFAGVVMSGNAAVQAYADMQAEEANVRKFTGMTADEVARLNAEFKKLDTRTAREDLNRLAQEAGRLGKKSVDEVLGFVKAADKINVALDDLGEGATLTLSKLTGIFGDEAIYGTEKSLLKVGSVINELSQNCSASAPYLAEFSSRLGGIAAQSKMTISQIMSFAAVLDTQNLAVEASATAVGQLITQIYQEPDKIAKAAQLDVKRFSDMVRKDMNGALLMLFEHLNKFGGMETLATVFDEMGTDGARAIPVLAALSSHIEELKWQQTEASKAFAEGVSVTNEFDVQNNTDQAGLDKARKGFTEMAVALGEKLLPVMRYCISGTSMLMRVMNALVGFFLENKKVVLTLASVVIAYNLILDAHVIKLKLVTTWTKLWAATTSAFSGVGAVFKVIVAGMRNAVQYFTNGLYVNYTMQQRWSKAMSAMTKASWVGLILALAAAVYLWYSRTKSLVTAQEKLVKIHNDAAEACADQTERLRMLEKVASDETRTLDERKRAIDELNSVVPDYNGYLDETSGLYTANKEALDKYIDSLVRFYEIEGAKSELADIGKAKADLVIQRKRALDELDAALMRETAERQRRSMNGGGSIGEDYFNPATYDTFEIRVFRAKVENLDKKISEYESQQKGIINAYGVDALTPQQGNTQSPSEVKTGLDYIKKESEKERRAREKAEREEMRKRKEALKQELDERKAAYNQAEAENLTLYVTAGQDYLAYCKKREELENDYIEDVVAIHERHNKLDIAAYGDALRSKANLLKKHQDEQRKRSLAELEQDHADTTDALVRAYHDPSGPDFQNAKLLNQMLLQEDIRYLQEKARLYLEGSEERAAIEQEITRRVEQDKLDKQKEMAQALMQFEQEYRKSSGSRREKMELDMLAELHKARLISEEEYQKAVLKVKEKYRNEDKDKARQTQSEYGDMVTSLYDSFSKFFDELGKEGSDFWDNLTDAAEAAYAIMAAGISMYSSYANAERDLELAKTEKRYDREIAAAGKNEKKKEALEKKKEADIAKIKKKYNDKAMKMELSQAIAQTATAAIAAYASASKEHWLLGPVAAAMAIAAGTLQIATIKKQHEAQAAGYYEGGFTSKDPDDRKEVGVVHANEFVANHEAVANPALAPVLRLIDHAQRNNTVGSLTATDVSRAIGTTRIGVGAGGGAESSATADALAGSVALMADINAATRSAIDRLSDSLENGIQSYMVMDGENGFHSKYEHFKRLRNNPHR